MRSLPNIMTISRIIGSLTVPFLIVVNTPKMRLLAFILFVMAAFTDWLDGYLARQLNASTSLGRMLDPVADKLLVAGILLALASTDNWGWIMFIPAVLILIREVFVSGLREYMSGLNLTIHVTAMAKYKTTFQLIALGSAIITPITPAFWQITTVTTILIWVAAVMTVMTGWDYLRKALAHDRKS
jgi:CDP-diacylglycerol--glycerol-3-phosphate 3-phosphatidyltransferase